MAASSPATIDSSAVAASATGYQQPGAVLAFAGVLHERSDRFQLVLRLHQVAERTGGVSPPVLSRRGPVAFE